MRSDARSRTITGVRRTEAAAKAVFFADCHCILVIPPLENEVDFEEKCIEEATAKDSQTRAEHPRSSVCVMRHSILQGELLHFAMIVFRVADRQRGGGNVTPTTDEEWTEGIEDMHLEVDLLTKQFFEEAGQKEPSVSAGPQRDFRYATALSSYLWEAQALPMTCADSTEVNVKRLAGPAVAFFVKLPLTVNPAYLQRTLTLRATLSQPESLEPGPATMASAPSFEGQMSTWAKLSTLRRTEDLRVVQQRLSAPSIETGSFLPFGSAATSTQLDTRRLGGRVDPSEGQQIEDPTSQSIDLLSQCIAEPALKEFSRRSQRQAVAVQALTVVAEVWVQRPIFIATALSESLLHVQIDNVTEDASVVVEDVQLRGLNAHTFGDLPVLLGCGDKYCLILGIEPSLVEALALAEPQPARSPTSTYSPGGYGSPREGERAATTKCILPLCLKWRPAGKLGENASIWSQFGAELRVPLPSPLEVSFTCVPSDTASGVLSVVVTVKATQADMDLTAHLPSAEHRASCGGSAERPPLFPLVAKVPFGPLAAGSSQSAHIRYLVTRRGVHSFPAMFIHDAKGDSYFAVMGARAVVR